MTSAPPPPPPTGPGSGAAPPRGRAAGVSAVLVMLEALVLLGFVVFYGYGILSGGTSDAVRAVTSGLLILVFAIGLLVLARGWLQGRDWPRTPTVLWNALLLPVAWSLWQSERQPLALAVLALAGMSIVAALSAPPRDGRREARDRHLTGEGSDPTERPGP